MGCGEGGDGVGWGDWGERIIYDAFLFFHEWAPYGRWGGDRTVKIQVVAMRVFYMFIIFQKQIGCLARRRLIPSPEPIHLLGPVGPILGDAFVGPCCARGPFICWAPGPVGAIHLLGPVGTIHLLGPVGPI